MLVDAEQLLSHESGPDLIDAWYEDRMLADMTSGSYVRPVG